MDARPVAVLMLYAGIGLGVWIQRSLVPVVRLVDTRPVVAPASDEDMQGWLDELERPGTCGTVTLWMLCHFRSRGERAIPFLEAADPTSRWVGLLLEDLRLGESGRVGWLAGARREHSRGLLQIGCVR